MNRYINKVIKTFININTITILINFLIINEARKIFFLLKKIRDDEDTKVKIIKEKLNSLRNFDNIKEYFFKKGE